METGERARERERKREVGGRIKWRGTQYFLIGRLKPTCHSVFYIHAALNILPSVDQKQQAGLAILHDLPG